MSFQIKIDSALCDGNGTCYEVCPCECFTEPSEGKCHVDEDTAEDCTGCRACETQCPKEAIEITED